MTPSHPMSISPSRAVVHSQTGVWEWEGRIYIKRFDSAQRDCLYYKSLYS